MTAAEYVVHKLVKMELVSEAQVAEIKKQYQTFVITHDRDKDGDLTMSDFSNPAADIDLPVKSQ